MPNTIFLAESLRFWPSPSFSAVLKNELEALPAGQLPLPLVRGNATLEEGLDVMVLRVAEAGAVIQADLGVFFSEMVVGCSCSDDPVPEASYCELRLSLDKETGAARFRLLRHA